MYARTLFFRHFLAALWLLAPALAFAGPGTAAGPGIAAEPTGPEEFALLFEAPPELTLSEAARSHLFEGRGDAAAQLPPVEIRWRDSSVSTPGGQTFPADLRLELTLGPTVPMDGTRMNILADVRGELSLGTGPERGTWRIEAGHFAAFWSKFHVLPEAGEVWVFLPAVFRNPAADLPGVHATFSIIFDLDDGELSWNRAGLWEIGRTLIEGKPDSRRLAGLLEAPPAVPAGRPAAAPESHSGRAATSLRFESHAAASLPRAETGLSPLTEVEEGLPSCTEEIPFLHLDFPGGRLTSPDGAESQAEMRLRLTPGPSYTDRHGRVRNVLLGGDGLLTLGAGETAHTVRVTMDHHGSLRSGSTFSPATGRLRLTLPVAFDDPMGAPLRATLSIACLVAGTGLSCTEVGFQAAPAPGIRPLADLLHGSDKVVRLGSRPFARAAGLDEPGPNAAGCPFLCPTCNANGCANGSCPAPRECGTSGTSSSCCMSPTQWSCRNCTVSACPQVVGTAKVFSPTAAVDTGGEGCPFTLTRNEELAPGERFLVEEWAVVTFQGEGSSLTSRVADASTLDFARTKAACLADGRLELKAEGPGGGFALLVDHPVHPLNERHIPLPAVRFDPLLTSQVGPEVTAAVRFQVDASRAIRQIDLLHADGELPEGVLDQLGARLEIAYETEHSHWLSAYGIFRVANGRVEMDDSLVVLPQCCDECPPPPYHCN